MTLTSWHSPQSLTWEQYEKLMQEIAVIGQAVGRWPQKFPISTAPRNDFSLVRTGNEL
ncbi:MAG: hypothetical protein AB4426_34015 [Xenococcaceae cyanobacterium]